MLVRAHTNETFFFNQLQVRSIRLDVKVWEPTILDLFCTLGNSYCNSLWESLLRIDRYVSYVKVYQ